MEEKKKTMELIEYFNKVELTKEYEGYFCSIGDAIGIVIIGMFCGFKSVKQIHQWASHEKIKEELKRIFNINKVPCYYWLLCLIKIIEPKSLNECFTDWTKAVVSESIKDKTISFDGKTIRSTTKIEKYKNPLHIVSAQIAEYGMTLGQISVDSKSNEIPAVRKLLKMLDITGTLVVADALNCQKETAQIIIDKQANYILSVKDNQARLKEDIEDYVQDKELRNKMNSYTTLEKQSGRIEKRTAYITQEIEWLPNKENWAGLSSIGAIHRETTSKKGATNEWHYYIISTELTAEEFLDRCRKEWSVETMHWLLDVHFEEDFCRIADDSIQKNLNILRKTVINSIRNFKNVTKSKAAFSHIMLDCLIDMENIPKIIGVQNNK